MPLIDLIVSLNMTTQSANLSVYLCDNTSKVTNEQLKNFIEVYHATHDFTGSWEDWQKLTPEQRMHPDDSFEVVISDNYLTIRTDENNQRTINWLLENLNTKQLK